jgi:hypothetical protein
LSALKDLGVSIKERKKRREKRYELGGKGNSSNWWGGSVPSGKLLIFDLLAHTSSTYKAVVLTPLAGELAIALHSNVSQPIPPNGIPNAVLLTLVFFILHLSHAFHTRLCLPSEAAGEWASR